MLKQVYNPDVLTCLANLSSDEVFTPPSVVNQMLDTLPKELWSDEKVTFLDPVSKSGVFLREITKRLIDGLESKIPNLEDRIEHILRNQVFGIGITELTSLISRRSLYCSKYANGDYSIVQFDDEQGNLKYFETEHIWERDSCKYCGVSKEIYDRGEELESYSYSFIHSEKPEKLFNMKFDVIVGNPPYQMNDGGGSNGISAKPIYQKFISTSKKLNPKFISMIIPARWFAGGKGLDSFREEMLNDKRIKTLVDYPKSRECFSGVDIAGGVCYFLWDKHHSGDCEVINIEKNNISRKIRNLAQHKIFVRDNIGTEILDKVLSLNEKKLSEKVLTRNSFGFTTKYRGKENDFKNSIKLISSSGISFININEVIRNIPLVEYYKVSVGTLNPDRGGVNNSKDGKMNVTTKVKLLQPKEVVTETYIIIDYYKSEEKAKNCSDYIKSKFVRFLISLTLSSMHIVQKNFQFVPLLDFNENWSDEKLYKRYGLNQNQIDFIESKIKPMV